MSAHVHSTIQSALMIALTSMNLGLEIDGENLTFDVPNDGSLWLKATNLPNLPSVATLGDEGQDLHNGIFQVDINAPIGTGTELILTYADLISAYFTAGRQLTYDDTVVRIVSCGRSNGRKVDNWYRVSMSIEWFTHDGRLS